MHTNHRRKRPFHHKVKNEGGGRYGGSLAYSLTWWRRDYWSSVRMAELTAIASERYDDLPECHRHSILWNYF